MKRVPNWIIFVLVLFIISFSVRDRLIKNPIRIQHPCPKLTTDFPILKTIDGMFFLTAGCQWNEVKEKATGDMYIVGFDVMRSFNINDTSVLLSKTNDRLVYKKVSRKQYLNDYEDIEKVVAKDAVQEVKREAQKLREYARKFAAICQRNQKQGNILYQTEGR